MLSETGLFEVQCHLGTDTIADVGASVTVPAWVRCHPGHCLRQHNFPGVLQQCLRDLAEIKSSGLSPF